MVGKKVLVRIAAVAAAVVPALAQAASIGVNVDPFGIHYIGDTNWGITEANGTAGAPGVQQKYWQPIESGGLPAGGTITLSNLLDDSGASTAADITVSGVAGTDGGHGDPNALILQFSGYQSAQVPGASWDPNDPNYTGPITGTKLTVALTDLPAEYHGGFDVYAYVGGPVSWVAGFGTIGDTTITFSQNPTSTDLTDDDGTYFVNSAPYTGTPLTGDAAVDAGFDLEKFPIAHVLHFTGLTGSSVTMDFTAEQFGWGIAGLQAFQVVASPVPEPGMASLLAGAALLGLVRRRRA
jgi:hypothetical protein